MPIDISTDITEQYDETYKEACFYAWYNAGCPQLQKTRSLKLGSNKIVKILPFDKNGRKPKIDTIISWMSKYGWAERADALDGQVSIQLDKVAIQRRVEQLKKLEQAGSTMLDKGLAFITGSDEPFKDNPSAAVRAVLAGSEMMEKYGGAADKLTVIQKMTSKQLNEIAARLLGKESNDENEDEAIEATLDDAPSDDGKNDNE